MSSNAYIASDREKLMKVGKANDTKRREKQINLPINVTLACLDEATAFRVEDQLRQFIVERGGIKHASTLDWFAYDPQIYTMLCEFAGTLDGFEPIHIEDEGELEIRAIRKRYFQLIEAEKLVETKSLKSDNENLGRQISYLEAELNRLHQELETTRNYAQEERKHFHEQLDAERKEKYAVSNQLSEWRGMFIGIKQSLIDRGDKPMLPKSLLNVLKSLVPEIFE